MRAQTIGVVVLLLVGTFTLPHIAMADVVCGQTVNTAAGVFSNQVTTEYGANGLLIEHFHLASNRSEGISTGYLLHLYDDGCNTANSGQYFLNADQAGFFLPSDTTDWSIRYASTTHFDIWDDTHDAIVGGQDLGNFPSYFTAVIQMATGIPPDAMVIAFPPIRQGATPPTYVNAVAKPEACSSGGSASPIVFDSSYDNAEYVGGLLHVHLRVNNYHYDGLSYADVRALEATADCGIIVPTYSTGNTSFGNDLTLPAHIRYYSFRFTSPTHWVVWDDDNDKSFSEELGSCGGACQGDIATSTTYVSFSMLQQFGHQMWTTPRAPTAPASPPPPQGCVSDCESNIIFIPGFEGSRLYQNDNGTERQRWEPGLLSLQSDALALLMNPEGTSVNDIYTKSDAAIDTVFPGTNIYKTFIQLLQSLKSTDVVRDVAIFPYDWRKSPEDVADNGTEFVDGIHVPEQVVMGLASSSKSGKVTIIAHSNGGLVAKALMQKLEAEGKANLVDKLILVDVPQLGTPKTIASMLHGDFQDLGFGGFSFVLNKQNARTLGDSMPASFSLLPSASYFAKVATPVIDLTKAPSLRAASGISGNAVTSSVDLTNFLTGTGGRAQPNSSDIETPSVLSSALLSHAVDVHQSLDNWQPPAGIQVIQIAGWGLDTPATVSYFEKTSNLCLPLLPCRTVTNIRHVVKMTEDGDDTVVSPSEVSVTGVSNYFLNVIRYNNDTHSNFKHYDILELPAFQSTFALLSSTSSIKDLPQYVSTTQPSPDPNGRTLRLRVLSPVTLDAYDSSGRHTGTASNPNAQSDLLYKEEQIPNSYYDEFGEGKYIGLPADDNFKVILHGLDSGTFTFDITPVNMGVEGAPISFTDVPVTASTTAVIDLSGASPQAAQIALDVNGDGKPDTSFNSAQFASDATSYAKLTRGTIASMYIGAKIKRQLVAKLNNVIFILSKSGQWDDVDDDGRDNKGDAFSARVMKRLDKIVALIQKEVVRPASKSGQNEERISPSQAAGILDMISRLRTLITAQLQ